MKLLVVEDHRELHALLRTHLERAGFAVDAVTSGKAALDVLAVGDFDALVLDWNMPDLDGIDVCRQLMADPSWSKVPILFLTGASHEGAEQEALAAGARGVIFKPFDPMTVGEQVKALIDA